MLDDITSPLQERRHKQVSWQEGSSVHAVPSTAVYPVDAARTHADRALIVYQTVRKASSDAAEVAELLVKARTVIPAIMNYLYFGSTQVAVVYFGKRVNRRGVKSGIRDGAQDLKIRLVRYLTAEMWPPLLRTDAPDESLGLDYVPSAQHRPQDGSSPAAVDTHLAATAGTAVGGVEESSADMNPSSCSATAQREKEVAQERLWFRRSVENQMQVLLYLKNSTDGQSKYLKVVLQNTGHRLYFDVTDPREEKYRWDLRMLFTRMMDNLETQKAIDSYEAYLEFFREACAMAAKHALFLERPRQSMLEVVLWSTPRRVDDGPLATLQPAEQCGDNHDGTVEGEEPVTPLRLPAPSSITATTSAPLPPLPRDATSETMAPRSVRSREAGVAVSQVLERRCSVPESAQWRVRCVPADEDSDTSSNRVTPPLAPLAARLTAPRSPTPVVSNASLLSPNTLGTRHTYAKRARGYRWMSNLQKPESATLDYKSYFFNTASEISHRCVKFMCGFLNAYGEGKLVVGVHEIPRGPGTTGADDGVKIVLHNDLIDQYVVGARVSAAELECLQVEVSEQLLCCIPPIPPRAVRVDAVPVRFPANFAYAPQVLVLYDFANPHLSARDALKQKSNYAIRFLFTLGLSIVPIDLPVGEVREMLQASHAASASSSSSLSDPPPLEVEWANVNTEAYLIAAVDGAASLETSAWAERLAGSLGRHKQRCYHAVIDYAPARMRTLTLPELFVLEVSVDIKRCGYAPLMKYRGKFFAGWPSIPVWDPTARAVRAVERNYSLLAAQPAAQLQSVWQRLRQSTRLMSAGLPLSDVGATSAGRGAVSGKNGSAGSAAATAAGSSTTTTTRTYTSSSASPPQFTSAGKQNTGLATSTDTYSTVAAAGDDAQQRASFQRQLVQEGWAWFAQPAVLNRVLSFLYGPQTIRDVLQFRLIHPLTNFCFENRQGNYLVQMLYSTPVGVPVFNSPPEQISRIQYSFLHAGLPPLPLLLCHCYETIGNLPSPYPYVAVPLVQQTFRVAPCLVPLFYRQHYFDGQMRLAVVLDLRDSLLKTVELRNGNLMLDAVVGLGFEAMNKRQLMRHFLRRRQTESTAAGAAGLPRNGSLEALAGTGAGSPAALGEEDGESFLLKESFLARRAFQPQALTGDTESRMGSLIMSPLSTELMHASTEREVEADIPLLHFSFLSRKAVEKGGYLRPTELPRSWRGDAEAKGSGSPAEEHPSLRLSRSRERQSCTPRPPGAKATTHGPRSQSTPPSLAAVDGADGGSDCSGEGGDLSVEMGGAVAHGRPWTLQHLLYWYNAFLTDREHYSVFGCGNRSIAFRVSSLSEVCRECVEPGAAEAVHSSALAREDASFSFAPNKESCVLHRKVHDWLAV